MIVQPPYAPRAFLQADRATSKNPTLPENEPLRNPGKQENFSSAELTFKERVNLRGFFDLLVE